MAEPESTLATDEDEDVSKFLATWEQLGREAIGAQPTTPRPLREIIADCTGLVVRRLWIDNGRNITETARALDISRRRVREMLKAWHRARGMTVITSANRSTQFSPAPVATRCRPSAEAHEDDNPAID